MRALEDAERGDGCDACGYHPGMEVAVAWDHDEVDLDEQETAESEYCPSCGNPSVLVIRWPDQETLEERGGGA